MPATPNLAKSYSLSNEPIGHHVLECSKETLQDTLKEVIHSTPVEPLTGPPKIVHPFPEVSPQTLLLPPPEILTNFSVKLNSIAKMHTSPPPKAAQRLTALTTQPKVMIKRMSSEEIQSHTNSAYIGPPPEIQQRHISLQCIINFFLSTRRHIYIGRLSEETPTYSCPTTR